MTLQDLSPDSIISTPEAGELLGISAERIRQLEKMGYIRKVERGRWHVSDVVQGYLHYLRESEYEL
ncbi:MAG TPA: hypothetical protein DIU07_19945 [Rhodobacteraceae bacterium]|nr:hypothetical protein [Paracoccaceae bacterium]